MAARSPNVRLRKAFNRREREARYIVSDCDSVEELFKDQHYTKILEEAATKTILSGLDLDRGSYLGQYTGGAVKQALVDEASINNAVMDNFATLMRLGPKDVCTLENQELAREAARQGIVLLKYSPVIGPNANATIQGS